MQKRRKYKYILDAEEIESIMVDRELTVKSVTTDAEIGRSTWHRIMREGRPTCFPNVAALAFTLGVTPERIVLHKLGDMS